MGAFPIPVPPPSPAREPARTDGPTLTNLRRAGLTTQLEIHDRQQLEIRFSYAIGSEAGPQRYTVDSYFFIPRNVGVNRSNFTREHFYGDVTALMRLDAAPLPLDQLADAELPQSPLHRFSRALEGFRTSPKPPPSRPIAVHVKLYAYLFTLGVRAELGALAKRLKGPGPATPGEFEEELAAALARMRQALFAYRRVRSGWWPFEKICHQQFAEEMRAADEYMSLYLEERLTMFLEALAKDARRYDGSGFVARCRLQLGALAREEAAYRRRYGYLTLTHRGLREGEYFTYRSSVLKKSVQQALYLDPREVKEDTFVRNAVGAVAAALAAIWATALAMQLPGSFAGLPSSTKFAVFTIAVLAYVLKDRIKAVTNEALVPRLRKHDHTWWLHGESLATVGLGMMRARLREAMRFVSGSDVPPDILSMRLTRRTMQNAERHAEEVIHYRKTLEVGTRDDDDVLPDGYWVRDILRLNVRHFLVRLDDPLDHVSYFDPARDAFATAELPKVYHLNMVVKVVRENASGQGHERLEHMRVVLNKDGIVRVEQADARGPHPLPPRPKPVRLKLPFRLW